MVTCSNKLMLRCAICKNKHQNWSSASGQRNWVQQPPSEHVQTETKHSPMKDSLRTGNTVQYYLNLLHPGL